MVSAFGLSVSSIILGIVVAATMGITLASSDWTSIREEIVCEKTVEANRSVVWSVLVDTARYDDWSSVVSNVTGRVAPEQHLGLVLRALPFVSVPIEILSRFETERLRWAFVLLHRGYLSIEFTLGLFDEPDGCTRVRAVLFFRGALVNSVFPFVASTVESGQEQFLADLAAHSVHVKLGGPSAK